MPGAAGGRREQLWKAIAGDGVDAFLVTSATNVSYLTGFLGEDAALLLAADRPIIVSDGRYVGQLERECPDVERHIRPVGQSLVAAIAEVAQKLGARRIGFEAASVSVAEFERLGSNLPAAEWKPLHGRVEALRAIKDDAEIAAIRESIRAAERAFAMLRAGMRLDETEKDATDLLEGYLRRCGASAASFPPIVAVGRNAALPHYRGSSQTRIGDDDFVLIDWGAAGQPYKSDLTRVLVTGKVTPKFEQVYAAVLAAQERGIAALRPGVKARDVDAEARAAIEEAGFGPFFTHALGHGLGMDIHECPWLRSNSDTILRPGMVVTVEPGIYLPDWGGVRIEDDVLVTQDGAEVLTHVPKALDSVRL